MRIRRTSYLIHGQPVTLPFIAAIADQHPEAVDAPPPPAPPQVAERRGPRMRYIRRVLGKDAEPFTARDAVRHQQILQRIARGGA